MKKTIKIKVTLTEEQYLQLVRMIEIRNNALSLGHGHVTPLDQLHVDIMKAGQEYFVPMIQRKIKEAVDREKREKGEN